jgi:hypothetical protein
VVPHSQSSLAFLTEVWGYFSGEIHTILQINVIVLTFESQTCKNVSHKFALSVLILGLKNLGFYLSEHCE